MVKTSNKCVNKKFKELRKTHPLREGGRENEEELEFAHIQLTELSGRGRGKSHRYYDIINNPQCYALLTKRTHIYLDNLYKINKKLR